MIPLSKFAKVVHKPPLPSRRSWLRLYRDHPRSAKPFILTATMTRMIIGGLEHFATFGHCHAKSRFLRCCTRLCKFGFEENSKFISCAGSRRRQEK